jgi:hypothetical protein
MIDGGFRHMPAFAIFASFDLAALGLRPRNRCSFVPDRKTAFLDGRRSID